MCNHSVGNQFTDGEMLRLVAACFKGNDGNRALERCDILRARLRGDKSPGRSDAVGPDRSVHMFEIALAHVVDIGVQLRRELISDLCGDDDFSRACQCAKACRQIDIRAANIMFVRCKLG